MQTTVYAVYFEGTDEFNQALELLGTARIATSALHSSIVMRLEVFSWHDEDLYRLMIDATTKAGRTLVRILTALLEHHIGVDRFTVCPAFEDDVEKISTWKQAGCAG